MVVVAEVDGSPTGGHDTPRNVIRFLSGAMRNVLYNGFYHGFTKCRMLGIDLQSRARYI